MDVQHAETAPSLPYHEPAILTILVQSSFLLVLNLVSLVLDRLVYCGLLGQVQPLLGATPVQAFAAGAALCSTSLGTTFTVLA